MASPSHLDDEDVFVGDFPGTRGTRNSGSKRGFEGLDDDDDDIFVAKKRNSNLEETAPGVATGMILSLRESLQKCKEDLSKCKMDFEAMKSENQKWLSAFENEPFVPEPISVVNYLQTLRSSEESYKDQVEKAKKKEAAFIKSFAKRDQEVMELKSAVRELRAQLKPPSLQSRKLLLDPAIHEEFTRLKNLVEERDKKVKELEEHINAINFTPQSKFGKMLMAKCRTLQEENEEIGYQASEGKMNELATKLALQKSQYAELRNQYEALYKHADAADNDVDRANEMLIIMQEKLQEKDIKLGEKDMEIGRQKLELQKLELELQQTKLELQQKKHMEEDNDATTSDTIVKDEVLSPKEEGS
ncbi:FKBP12-interacting protein of 37 kDa [Dionaea muscipula]